MDEISKSKQMPTLLQTAVLNGQDDVITFLLDHGANIDADAGKEDSAPLILAIGVMYNEEREPQAAITRYHNPTATVDLLLRHGANRDRALCAAAQNNYLPALRLLLQDSKSFPDCSLAKIFPQLSASGPGLRDARVSLLFTAGEHREALKVLLAAGVRRITPNELAFMTKLGYKDNAQFILRELRQP
jgi:ankyrin repeat protein